MKLAIGNDHVAVEMKREIKAYLEEKGIEVLDVGTNSTERFHYPISGYRVARLVADGAVDGGVLICGTGVGISLAANKVHGIRACVCSEPATSCVWASRWWPPPAPPAPCAPPGNKLGHPGQAGALG